jgi:hypothetical protein
MGDLVVVETLVEEKEYDLVVLFVEVCGKI